MIILLGLSSTWKYGVYLACPTTRRGQVHFFPSSSLVCTRSCWGGGGGGGVCVCVSVKENGLPPFLCPKAKARQTQPEPARDKPVSSRFTQPVVCVPHPSAFAPPHPLPPLLSLIRRNSAGRTSREVNRSIHRYRPSADSPVHTYTQLKVHATSRTHTEQNWRTPSKIGGRMS